ncbi:unnamed protein product [Brachionus calyciflorus]|uniref:Uncharacterized protein n=1 Tax=Brachionus calyciflorus TaxID=104777 RepID=A0A814JUP5_9BILA|nr:unnamed protein product [Brachionus calyciflorus]
MICIGARSVSLTESKRSTIQLFSTIISLNLVEFKSRILEIYLSGMSNENDSLNLQLLFSYDLDNVATRTYSKAFIFCVRSNKTSLKLIQESLNLKLNDQFYEFVNTLGNIVSVNNSNDNKNFKDLNGLDSSIYWSDVSNELSFILANNSKNDSLVTDFYKTKSQTLPNDQS